MNMFLIAESLHTAGVILIGLTALQVHHRVLNEHKIDRKVFKVMKFEQKVGVFGIILIIASFIVKVFYL